MARFWASLEESQRTGGMPGLPAHMQSMSVRTIPNSLCTLAQTKLSFPIWHTSPCVQLRSVTLSQLSCPKGWMDLTLAYLLQSDMCVSIPQWCSKPFHVCVVCVLCVKGKKRNILSMHLDSPLGIHCCCAYCSCCCSCIIITVLRSSCSQFVTIAVTFVIKVGKPKEMTSKSGKQIKKCEVKLMDRDCPCFNLLMWVQSAWPQVVKYGCAVIITYWIVGIKNSCS